MHRAGKIKPTRSSRRHEGGQRKWSDKEVTYVSNEKLGASVLEWDVTAIRGNGRGGLLNDSIYLFVSRWMGDDGLWLCWGSRGGRAWGI